VGLGMRAVHATIVDAEARRPLGRHGTSHVLWDMMKRTSCACLGDRSRERAFTSSRWRATRRAVRGRRPPPSVKH
jgi:hypothetical protein